MSVKSTLRDTVHVLRRAQASLGVNRIRYSLRRPFCHKRSDQDCAAAREALERYSPNPNGAVYRENRLCKPFAYDLQIIIPAYNSEDYLTDALESVVRQKTDYTYCVFLIDDGSKDGTYDICESYQDRDNFYVIHQENGGFSDARNRGLKTILARYVMFLDSDDLLVDGCIQALLDAAFRHDADVVQGGSYSLFEGQLKIRRQYAAEERVDAEQALEGMAWAKVYRSRLFQSICFPKDFWFEDTINTFLLYPLCESAYVIPDMTYQYRMHAKSISHTFSRRKKAVDTIWITEALLKERERRQLPDTDGFLQNLKRQIIINYKRLAKLPAEIQEDAFALERELLLTKPALSGVCGELYDALQTGDFGAYRNYCRFH